MTDNPFALPKEFYVRSLIDVSTGHITHGDSERLEYCADGSYSWTPEEKQGMDSCGLVVESKDQGFVVFDRSSKMRFITGAYDFRQGAITGTYDLRQDGDFPCPAYCDLDEAEHRQRLADAGFSQAFIYLLGLAAVYGFGLWLDADAPVYKELPLYDWKAESAEGKPVRDTKEIQ